MGGRNLAQRDADHLVEARRRHVGGDYSMALPVYRRLLRKYPSNDVVQSLLGTLHLDRGESERALPLLERVAEARRTDADSHYNVGLALSEMGRPHDAAAAYRRALRYDPGHPRANYNLARALIAGGEPDQAIEAIERDLALKPRVDALSLLSEIHASAGNLDAAIGAADRAASHPQAAGEHLHVLVDLLYRRNAAAATLTDEDVDPLVALAEHALEREPHSVVALTNLARVRTQMGDFEAAAVHLERAVLLRPEDQAVRTLYALVLLTLGDVYEGWRQRTLLDRAAHPDGSPAAIAGLPRWDGTATPGFRLAVTCEQGVGDQVLYARMFAALRERGVPVMFRTDPRLVSVLGRSLPDVVVEADTGAPAEGCDAGCTLGELHLWLPESEPGAAPPPWLVPDPDRVSAYRARYTARFPGQPLVGIAWKSHSGANGAGKSIPIEAFSNVLATPGCAFVSIQYGAVEADLARLRDRGGLTVFADPEVDAVADLEDAAAQLAALDLVISVSNTAVHLAGAMGVPTWVLVGKRPVWHWFLQGDTSPWYSSVRLFRQTRLDGWGDPLRAVADALQAWCGAEGS